MDIVIRKEDVLGVRFEFKEPNKSQFISLEAHPFLCFRAIGQSKATFKDKSGKVYGINITDKKNVDLSEMQNLGLGFDPYKVFEGRFNQG
jgi:hypothetical protein